MNRFAFLLLFIAAPATALPLYGARSGRTCDNCHSLPNTWFDPPEVLRRKCTLSCAGCHVDPSGGGLRTVSGRFFGASTLPMFRAEHRPLDDRQRDLLKLFLKDKGPTPTSQPTSGPVKAVAKAQVDPRGSDAAPADDGLLAFGRPLGHGTSEMAWLDGRYADHNADPLLLMGADARFAFWSQGPLFFPMQADVYAAIHPVEHLTLSTTVGARGRTRSFLFEPGPQDEDGQPRFGVKDVWLMTHEWPGLAYARVGRFMPAFGTRVADHTAWTRRGFELSQEDPANRVLGAEIGFTANYPHATASVFKPSSLDAQNPFEAGDGWGAAINGGWRDLGWQLGGSAMLKRRPLAAGGDTTDVSVQAAFNFWFYWKGLPLTWLGEVAGGQYQRQLSGTETKRIAHYHQLAWTPVNGLVVRLRHDAWDPDTDIEGDAIHKPGAGLDWTIIPGLTISADGRLGLPERGTGGEAADLFLQLHGWL